MIEMAVVEEKGVGAEVAIDKELEEETGRRTMTIITMIDELITMTKRRMGNVIHMEIMTRALMTTTMMIGSRPRTTPVITITAPGGKLQRSCEDVMVLLAPHYLTAATGI